MISHESFRMGQFSAPRDVFSFNNYCLVYNLEYSFTVSKRHTIHLGRIMVWDTISNKDLLERIKKKVSCGIVRNLFHDLTKDGFDV